MEQTLSQKAAAVIDRALGIAPEPADITQRLFAAIGHKPDKDTLAEAKRFQVEYQKLMADSAVQNWRALAKQDNLAGADSMESCLSRRQAFADSRKRAAQDIVRACGPVCIELGEAFALAISKKAALIETDERAICASIGMDFEAGPVSEKLRAVARAVREAAASQNSPARRLPWLAL